MHLYLFPVCWLLQSAIDQDDRSDKDQKNGESDSEWIEVWKFGHKVCCERIEEYCSVDREVLYELADSRKSTSRAFFWVAKIIFAVRKDENQREFDVGLGL